MWKKQLAAYFNFTKRERRGTQMLLLVVLLLIMAPFFYPLFIKEKKYDHTAFEKEIASLKIKQADSSKQYKNRNFDDNNYQHFYADSKDRQGGQQKATLFYFDPNTLDEAGWIKLGVKEKTAVTILKYVSKGGKFRQAADIDKIWGLSDYDKERLRPYVQIKETPDEKPAAQYAAYTSPKYEKPVYTKPILDINTSDTAAFIALPGIGSKLAQRIINFRDKLGGFISVDQVGETFGLADSTFQKIKPRLSMGSQTVKQIDINKATVDEMKAHPYMRYVIANAIVQYRTQHGNFKSITDLKKIMIITDEQYAKFSPYVKTE